MDFIQYYVSKDFRYMLTMFIIFVIFSMISAQDSTWTKIDEGLFYAEFQPAKNKFAVGDSKITVIKIDPELFTFKLLCASELLQDSKNKEGLSVRRWSKQFRLIASINAGMFQTDYISNVGYMKNGDYVNNPLVHKKYKSITAFNPVDKKSPPFKIFDLDKNGFDVINREYKTVIQNLRLIKRPGQNRWKPQNRMWSEAALGQDKKGNVLFIFSRSPYTMYEFNEILLSLPIDLQCAQHLEGGPEASLYLSHNGITIEKVGSYETDFNENDDNYAYLPIPNVLGIIKKNEE